MVNLLFISNNIKIHIIKNLLQPLLKVKIDAVSDFDLGLKEVFEKRPSSVFIQDQIDGVSGESVARHIQMLLGASSPSFIFMYEGTTRVKPIKGLFEYLIDLSQTEIKVVDDIKATLKSLLGQQWEKIYIPPPLDMNAITVNASLSEGSLVVADQLIDNFFSDVDELGSSDIEKFKPSGSSELEALPDDSFHVVSSPHDQLAEILSETNNKESTKTELSVVAGCGVSSKKISAFSDTLIFTQQNTFSTASPTPVMEDKSICATSQSQTDAIENISVVLAPLVSPADFVIVAERPNDDVTPEDLLRVFDGNFNSKILLWKKNVLIAVILVMCAFAISFYLFKQSNLLQLFISENTGKSAVVVPGVRPTETAALSANKSVLPPAQKYATSSLPSFIPQAGVDRSFSSKKPGWERYVDPVAEYRVYSVSGKIRALQVLAVNNKEISEPKMKSILIELLGDGDYLVKSQVKKHGYDIIQATVGQKADLLMYKKANFLQAFVVSLN